MESNSSGPLHPQSWRPLDRDYRNRRGYDAGFLGLPVALPVLAPDLAPDAAEPPLRYEHFSILMNTARRLAFWTAVNIDGTQERHLGDRRRDEWWFDERAPQAQQIGDSFYRGSGFQRGHLVRRLDPAWGETDAQSARGEADTFHWTNCSPQMPQLNTDWWLQIENHVLQTANAQDHKVSVYSGCLFGGGDPVYRGERIPLAFWKVIAWVVEDASGTQALRSLAFLVKQAEAVADLIRRRGMRPQGAGFEDVPHPVQAYQTTVAELSQLARCSFGDLARGDIDVLARQRSATRPAQAHPSLDVYRPLNTPAELLTR